MDSKVRTRPDVSLWILTVCLPALLAARGRDQNRDDRQFHRYHEKHLKRTSRAPPTRTQSDVREQLEQSGDPDRCNSEAPPVSRDESAESPQCLVASLERIVRALERANQETARESWPKTIYYASTVVLLFATAISLWFSYSVLKDTSILTARQAEIAESGVRPGLVVETASVCADCASRMIEFHLHNYGGGPARSATVTRLVWSKTAGVGDLCQGRTRYFSARLPHVGAAVWPSQTVELNAPLPKDAHQPAAFLAGAFEYGSDIEARWHCSTFVIPMDSTKAGQIVGQRKPDAARSVDY